MHRLSLLPMLLLVTATARAQTRIIPISIVTTMGTIEAELDSTHAPVTVANFLKYVDGHLLDSSSFFRAVTSTNQPNNPVPIEVIQSRSSAPRSKGFPPIALERTSVTGLKHLDGTLSMARSGPDTGTDQYFITIGPQPDLDFGGKRNADGQGFAAFGRVTQGMEIVRAIQQAPTRPNTDQLAAPVIILKVVRR